MQYPTQVSQQQRHRPHERYTAVYAKLELLATSSQAKTLVQWVYDDSVHWELISGQRTIQRSSARVAPFRGALERLIADTLHARSNFGKAGSVFRTLRDSEFSHGPVSYRNFRAAIEALSGLKLLKHEVAGVTWREENNTASLKAASRLRATYWLQHRAEKCGVSLQDVRCHFSKPD